MDQEIVYGPYRVVENLGEGGMGVVYRAIDTRLDRAVALKVLAPHLSGESDAAERFVREARAAASSEHTNICTIYDIGLTGEGRRYIAMPLYSGRTVRELIEEGPLDVDRALDISIQAARGLSSAHAHGISHRDIKPGNLIVTDDGTVKILDFGLAQRVDEATITAPGSTVGTAAYMSPEQVHGERLDPRTDIWSLGVVLHEMIAGSRPFGGDYPQAMVYAILNEDPPPLTALRSGVPIGLDAVVAKCLQKDRDSRYQHVDEIPADLRAIRAGSGSGSVSSSGGSVSRASEPSHQAAPRSRRPMAITFAVLAVLAAATAIWLLSPSPEPVPTRDATRLVMMLEPGSRLANDRPSVAISPDGSMVSYASVLDDTSRLYIRPKDSFQSRRLGGTEGAQMPFFSPDGRWIGYFTDDALYKVSVDGGRPRALVDIDLGNIPIASGTWTDDNRILYTLRSGRLGMVTSEGEVLGEIGELTARDVELLRFPDLLPDGKHVLATLTQATAKYRIVVVSLEDGATVPVVESGTHPRFLPTGHLVYAIESDLYVTPFDPDRLVASGPGTRVVEGVAHGLFGGTYYDVSDQGTLVYVSEGAQTIERSLNWVDSTGAMAPLPIGDLDAYSPRISPDGRYVAYQRRVPDDLHIYVMDTERNNVSRFTDADAETQEWWFAWTPDSRSLIFNSSLDSGPDIGVDLFMKSVSDAGAGVPLTRDAANVAPQEVSEDGRYVLYIRNSLPDEGTGIDIWVKDLETGAEHPAIATKANDFHPAVSPDGRWLAFASDRSGTWQTYVQPWPEGGAIQQVSTAEMGGGEPLWSREGDRLFFRSRNGRRLYETEVYEDVVTSGERSLRLGETREAVQGPFFTCSEWGRSYDVGPDGRFVMVRDVIPGDEMGQLNVVVGWLDEVRRRTAEAGRG